MFKIPVSLTETQACQKVAEPTTPNATKAFFKTVNHWTQLSGYMGHFLNTEKSVPNSAFLPMFQKNPIEISQGAHEAKVETAINYLVLRELGCSRENAMSLTSRKRPDNASFVKSLPKVLQKDFSYKISKNKCLPCRPPATFEEFDSISGAFKDLITRRQVFIEPTEINHQKNIEKLEENKERFQEKKKKIKEQKNRLNRINRVVVPDIIQVTKYLKTGHNTTNLILSADNSKIIRNSEMKSPNNEIYYKSFEKLDNSKLSPNMPKSKNLGIIDRSCKLSINSLSNETNSITTKSEQPKTAFTNSSRTQSEINIIPTYNRNLNVSSSKDFEILVHSDTKSETDSSEVDFNQLIDEDKKLINLIRVQKYRQAQLRGEEYSKALQKTKQRKKQQDQKKHEENLKKFEKKKEKIFLAKLKKENLLLRRKKDFCKLSQVKTP